MKIISHVKIKEWIDSSLGQSPVIQSLEEKRPTLSNLKKHKMEEGTLVLKMVLILFIV